MTKKMGSLVSRVFARMRRRKQIALLRAMIDKTNARMSELSQAQNRLTDDWLLCGYRLGRAAQLGDIPYTREDFYALQVHDIRQRELTEAVARTMELQLALAQGIALLVGQE